MLLPRQWVEINVLRWNPLDVFSMLLVIFIHHCPVLQKRMFSSEDDSMLVSGNVSSLFAIVALFAISCYVGPPCNDPAWYSNLLGSKGSSLDCDPSSRQFWFPSIYSQLCGTLDEAIWLVIHLMSKTMLLSVQIIVSVDIDLVSKSSWDIMWIIIQIIELGDCPTCWWIFYLQRNTYRLFYLSHAQSLKVKKMVGPLTILMKQFSLEENIENRCYIPSNKRYELWCWSQFSWTLVLVLKIWILLKQSN